MPLKKSMGCRPEGEAEKLLDELPDSKATMSIERDRLRHTTTPSERRCCRERCYVRDTYGP